MGVQNQDSDPEFCFVICLLCEASVRKKKFSKHIEDNHDVFFNHDLILRMTLRGKDSLEHMLKLNLEFNQFSADSIATDKQIKSIINDSNNDTIENEEEKINDNVLSNIQPLSDILNSNEKPKYLNDHVCHERIRTLTLSKKVQNNPTFGKDENITVVVTQCDKQFKSKYVLKRHKMLHTGIKPFSCQDCEKKFFRNSRLKRHQMWHTGNKPFLCLDCKKSFYTTTQLKRHEQSHSVENLLSCNECPKAFTRIENLKKHKKRHTGIKPFSCRECQKHFFTNKELKKHRNVHKGAMGVQENSSLDENSEKEKCVKVENDVNEFVVYDENKYMNIYEYSERVNTMKNENDLNEREIDENAEIYFDENSHPNINHIEKKTELQNNDQADVEVNSKSYNEHDNKYNDIDHFNKSSSYIDISSNVTNKTKDIYNDTAVKVEKDLIENEGNLLQISKDSLKMHKLETVGTKWNDKFHKCHICENVFPSDYRLKQHKKESGHKVGKGRPKKTLDIVT